MTKARKLGRIIGTVCVAVSDIKDLLDNENKNKTKAYTSQYSGCSWGQQNVVPDKATYADAISEIVSSKTNDYYKNEMIRYLKRDGDDTYYSSIIAIAKSSMNDYYRLSIIKKLNSEVRS